MPSSHLYPLDYTGAAATNRIVNETHNVMLPSGIDEISFIVPRAAPFFSSSLRVRRNGVLLVEGVHYFLAHQFVEALINIGAPVNGSITFLDRTFTGNVVIEYQTLGGQYTLDDYSIIETLTRSMYNIRFVTWSQIVGLPAGFPVLPHQHNPNDFTGFDAVQAQLTAIAAAITAANN